MESSHPPITPCMRSDWPVWRTYRDMRAKTSHTYDEAIALEVTRGIADFLDEAEYLLARLENAAL
ncbi:nucleotidyltransferase substrate binding protein like protein [mine drainage metagenome]|uniref:Nucleotidyltransferase substrate binding protein like protein n=1 Tax=mine drainage metagenome TaxID=410659 RepID=A0A1J5RQ86_9ZZZZ